MPEVEMVEGEEISREEANSPGWTTAVCRSKKVRAEAAPGSVPHEGVKGGLRTAAPQGVAKRLAAALRLPRLPRDHIRIMPRDGLDIKKVGQIWLAQAMAMAAALAPGEAEGDIVCLNVAQNVLVVSTPKKRNALANAGIQQIRLGEGSYTVTAYIAAPDNT